MDWITLRIIERILVVCFGGWSIYLGYRLFVVASTTQDSDGKFTFPHGISMAVVRVGPGVFFALFGAAILAASMWQAIELRLPPAASAAPDAEARGVASLQFRGAGQALTSDGREASADARSLMRREFGVLNRLTIHMKPDLPAEDRTQIEGSIRNVKLALMKCMWDDEAWGNADAFESWARGNSAAAAPASSKEAADYYRYLLTPR